MKNVIIAVTLASIVIAAPALAGSLADPVVEPDVVAAAAADDSVGKIDALMLTLLFAVVFAIAGGAF